MVIKGLPACFDAQPRENFGFRVEGSRVHLSLRKPSKKPLCQIPKLVTLKKLGNVLGLFSRLV